MGDYFVCSKTDPVVETKAGKVRGFRLNTTYAFHGIHYAEADRFQMPQPVKPWKGIKNALAYGYVCPLLKQDEPNMEVLVPHRYWPQDEHCQNLNVWTQSLDPGAKKPVMVWLHGGGFSAGSAIEHVAYEGDHLSEFGDVVVVSVNHRLNILGYLDLSPFGEKYKNSANAGNADMVAALQWVHDNIAAFGGDPQVVTAFGQSAGGTHLVDVVASPYAQGLLRGAIIQSPSAVAQWRSDAQADRAAEFVAQGLGAEPTRESLAKVPFEKLSDLPKIAGRLAADPEWAKFTDGNVSLFKGWIDQDVIPELPVDALRKGAARKMAFIVGSTSSEWRYYIVPNGAIAKKNRASAAALIAGANRPETVLEAYARVNRGKTWGDCFAQIQSDLIFRMPCVKLAESLAAGGAQVWTYDFAWESPVKGKSGASLGAAHTVDVPFVFQNLSAPRAVRTIGERPPQALAQAMHSAWLTFAKTGCAPWTPFSLDTRRAMRFDAKSQEVSDPWAFERLTLPAR